MPICYCIMRTTVRLSADLLRRAKKKAVEEGRTLTSLLEEGLKTALLEQPQCMLIQPGARHWRIFAELCVAADARGNLASDAWHAALALEAGCEWITLDRDYARFPGLKWSLPEWANAKKVTAERL